MAATAKASPAKRPPRRPPVPQRPSPFGVDDGEVVDLGDPEEAPEPERVPVFSIGGVVHTMLAEPGPGVTLRALELAERRGATEQAVAFADVQIMRDMLGEASYRALLDCKTMTRDQYLKIVGRVMNRAMGALEDRDGSPNR